MPTAAQSKPVPRPGEPRTTISQRVYADLRRAIISMELRPGDILSEAEMARKLGTSRQPVREAFIKLAETSFVEVMPQRGTFVKKISSAGVNNARFIRMHIEMAIARRCCEVAAKRDIDRILAIVDEQRRARRLGDQVRFLELDDDFHEAIAASADCIMAWHLTQDLKGQMDRVRFLSIPKATPMKRLIDQHQAVADAMVVRDADAAGEAMRVHLSEMLKSLPILAKRHAELFTD